MNAKDNMESEELISVQAYCTTSHVSLSLIDNLAESGLVQLTVRAEQRYIAADQLAHIERLVRLHDDLDINVEGLEAIDHLLQRMHTMQEELQRLRNRLRRYEHPAG
ncbi:MAG: hypothetical protein JST98_09460 [Bacteroidetes bacterium]|nr:hypothetical protein [Bacteroidota bacterium]